MPFILREGADRFAGMGTDRQGGTRLFSVSGHVNRPGLYEAPVGVTDDDGRIAGVRVTHEGRPHEARARMVLDASGRAGTIANQHLGTRVLNPKLRTVAVFKHFTDVDERKNPGVRGDIQIGSHPDGWIWAIPIRADKLSVGAVM